jgi:type II secretory pathway component PulJ
MSRAPIISEAGEHRDDPEEDHRGPVHREDLVVLRRGEELVLRLGQLDADQQGHDAADQEEEERGVQVEDAELLVVDRRQPRDQPLVLVPARRGLGPRQRGIHHRHH